MKHQTFLSILSLALLLISCGGQQKSVNYYFDAENGDDGNDGLSQNTPFKSLGRIADLNICPGDSILLKSGCVFTEPLYFSGSGSEQSQIVIGKYGGEALPHLKGDATELQMLHLFNCEHLKVENLEISNKGLRPRPYLNGILVEAYNCGRKSGVVLDRLFIHDVLGTLIKGEGMEHEDAGGGQAIMVRNFRDDGTDSIPSYFDGFTISNCLIKDSQRNGIIMWGNWIRSKWKPNLNVEISHNIIEGVPGDGIMPCGCDGALIEYNVMRNCPPILPYTEACDGIWPFSCDNTLIQYNVVSDHKSQTDGYAYDSDYNCRNSTFQYNLSYNNDGGFLLLCNSGGWPTDWSAGNTGTRVRYNVSVNDGIRSHIVKETKDDYYSPLIHITGPSLDNVIEKNIFYVGKKPIDNMDKRILHSDDWRGYADSTAFNSNFIILEEPNRLGDLTNSTRNYFLGNKYVGTLITEGIAGFEKAEGKFNSSFWLDSNDNNWSKLIEFLRDKSVPIDGKEVKVLKLLGFE